MKKYTIIIKENMSYTDVFNLIIDEMHFPDWCGKNPDAIWDLLTRNVVTPAIICFEGTASLKGELKNLAEEIIKMFFDASRWYANSGKHLEIKIVS